MRRPPIATASAKPEGRDRTRGQAITEFALVLPVFFLMFAGMFDFGLGMHTDMTLINAAREGARLGVVEPGNTTGVQDRVRQMASNLDTKKLGVSVTCERPSGSTFSACGSPEWQSGDATVVRVDYPYTMVFPLLFGAQIPLSAEVRMRIE